MEIWMTDKFLLYATCWKRVVRTYNSLLTSCIHTGLECLDCSDVSLPKLCQTRSTCGQGELCYTREFRDNKGNNRYRLGCESKEKCNVYTQILIGKRHLSERALPGDCYGCCSSDICNTKLCQGTSTTAPQINVKGCPANFVAFNGKCYLFDPTERNWKDQVSHCQGMGAGLLTIHSEEENNFIVSEMKNYNNIPGYYTGGVFGRDGQWEWMDGSVFDYTNWNSNYPNPHHKYDTNIVVVHESVPAGLQAGQWVTAGSTTHTYDGVICETKQQ